MFNLLCKLFISDYKNVKDAKVRERYGIVFSIFCIVCNLILVIGKLFAAFITNSVSIQNDALNNLSDCGSNIASILGFSIANKHADSKHPYGHGRMEYVASMIVSFLILLMGFEAAKSSLLKIIHPELINDSYVSIVVLSGSILIKILMGLVNKKAGKMIESSTLDAASQDSFNDCILTGSTLLCVLIFHFFKINLDAYMGLLVSVLVLKSGFEIFSDVLNMILGQAPDKELLHELKQLIMSHPYILGIHDLLLHDYGPNEKIMSLHAEVDANIPILDIHDEIDNIELEIKEKYHILTTIHMDPIDPSDTLANETKELIYAKIKEINPTYQIHDFRMVKGNSHCNLVFDVVLPSDDKTDENQLRELIGIKAQQIDPNYRCVIQFDRSYE